MAITSYIVLKDKIQAYCENNLQIKKFGGEFYAEINNFATKDEKYPIVFLNMISQSTTENTRIFEVDLYCLDIIRDDRANVNTIVSDTDLILNDLYYWFHDGNDFDVDIIGTMIITPLNNQLLDYAAGCVMRISFEVNAYTSCVIPLENPLPPSPTTNCPSAMVSNSDDSFEANIPSGQALELDDITITTGNGILTRPSNVDINLSDYFYVAFPTGTRVPQTIPIQDSNTQVAWLDLDKVTTGLGTITQSTGNYVYSRGSFSIPTLGDFRLEGRPRVGTSTFDATGYQTSFGFGGRFIKDLGSFDFGIYSYKTSPTSTLIGVRENGLTVFSDNRNVVEPTFKIERIGIQVRFYVNNTLVWTSYYPSSDPLSRGYAMGGVIQTFTGNITEDIKVTYL